MAYICLCGDFMDICKRCLQVKSFILHSHPPTKVISHLLELDLSLERPTSFMLYDYLNFGMHVVHYP